MPRKNAVSILFQATPEEKEQLQAYCEAHQRSQTEILRELIRTLPKATQQQLVKGRLMWGKGWYLLFIGEDDSEYEVKSSVQLPDGSYAKTALHLPTLVNLPNLPEPFMPKLKSIKAVTVELVDNVVVRIAEIH